MQVEATTARPLDTDADTIVVGVFEDEPARHDLPVAELAALLDSGEAGRSAGRLAVTHAERRRFILLGLGPRRDLDGARTRELAARAGRRARELRTRVLCWQVARELDDELVSALIEGTLLEAYRFKRYKRDEGERPHELERLMLSAERDLSRTAVTAAVIVAAQNRARDLGNTPANDLTPATLADYAWEQANRHAIPVNVLEQDAIQNLGMGAFTAVAQGSDQGARLIQLAYEGPGAADRPQLALIGKALTFDSGGISLKPPADMHEMKFDMCGGAAVIEAISALAELEAPVRVLGIVGAAENMVSGRAVRPGDIVRALDGTTIEVNNTDAEGRLVLADCISYAISEGADAIVDIATLTGGVVIALGSVYAGLMSNNPDLARRVEESGRRTGELVWQLPLHRKYAQMVKGRYADLKNRSDKREAMALTAGELLHHFAGETPWAHIDIAGTAWNVNEPYFDKGATGFGVRLLVDLARSFGN